MPKITGTFIKYSFFNKEDRYMIAQYAAADEAEIPPEIRSHGNIFSVGGKDLPRDADLLVCFFGNWPKSQNKYPPFLRLESFSLIAPEKGKSMIAFCAAQYEGIGKKTAERMYEEFGDDLLRITRESPDKLLNIKGISPKIVAAMRERNLENGKLFAAIEDFTRIGLPVSSEKALRLLTVLGDNAADKIKENPYLLCKVYGFGFLTAERIAIALNVKTDSKERVVAAANYCIMESEKKGNVCEDPVVLRDKVYELLNLSAVQVSMQNVRIYMRQAIKSEELIYDKTYNKFYRKYMLDAEKDSAFLLLDRTLSGERLNINDSEVFELIKIAEDQAHITLAPEQKNAVLMAIKEPASVITGGPGTGKSTILQCILEVYKKLYPRGKIGLAAPTGRAARRMAETTGYYAQTLHKFLGLRIRDESEDYDVDAMDEPPDFLAIDETSMVDIVLMKALLSALSGHPKTKILFIGDSDQLPSIGPGNVLSDIIKSDAIPVTKLNKIFRQEDTSSIIVNTFCTKNGNKSLRYDNDFRLLECNKDAEAVEIIVKEYEQAIKRRGVENVQVLSPFRQKTACGADALNLRLREIANPRTEDTIVLQKQKDMVCDFRVGDRIMQIKTTESVCNGDVGVILDMYKSNGETVICVNFNEEKFDYTIDDMRYVRLAYACSVHKSQGAEYSEIIMPMIPKHFIMLKRNLFYTAITRAKKRVTLVGQKKMIFHSITNIDTELRQSLLGLRLHDFNINFHSKS